MNLLYITQGFPEPRMVGGQISSYYRVDQLTRAGHDVTCLCLAPRDDAQTDPKLLAERCRVVAVRDVPETTPARLAANLFDPVPWPIRRYTSAKAVRILTDLIGAAAPELIVFNSLHSSPLLPAVRRVSKAPCLLFAPNVQSTIMRLFAEHQTRPHARLYAELQWRKMSSYESSHVSRFDAVCVYSREDADGLRALAPAATIEISPIAVDVDAMGTPAASEFDLLLTGSFRWLPNVDSLKWFLLEIHPRILERRPGTTLRVVGPGSEVWRDRPAARGVTFVGPVEDIAPCFRTARALVVPLRIGSGIRVKIVQAFGARLPVVSTSKGCEGLAVKHGHHLMIADGPEQFAAAAVRMLEDAALRDGLAKNGRVLVEREHDALAPDRPLVSICESIVESHARGSRP